MMRRLRFKWWGLLLVVLALVGLCVQLVFGAGAGTYPVKSTPGASDTIMITTPDATKTGGFDIRRVPFNNVPVSDPVQTAINNAVANIGIDTSVFGGNLATTDNTIQKIAKKFNDYIPTGGVSSASLTSILSGYPTIMAMNTAISNSIAPPVSAGNILLSNGSSWTSTAFMGISSIDMSTGLFSIPWAMGTSPAPTGGGKAYLNPETAELTVGSGNSTFVIPLQTPGATTHVVYASGTVYTMSNSSALIHFGTTDPTITIPYPGRWHIRATARLEYAGATEAANGLVSVKLRRTNNTAADLLNGSDFVRYAAVTAATGALGMIDLDLDYVTSNATDIISLYGVLDASPSAGSITCTAAKIYIQRIGGN